VPLSRVGAAPHLTLWPGPRFISVVHTKWHFDPSSRLAKIDMSQKFGDAVPLLGGSSVPTPHVKYYGLV